MLMQLKNTFYDTLTSLTYLPGWHFWSKLYKSTFSIYSSYSWFFINVPVYMYMKYDIGQL